MDHCKVCMQEQNIYEDIGHRCALCQGLEFPKVKNNSSFLQFPMPSMNRGRVVIFCKWDRFVILSTTFISGSYSYFFL